MARVDRNKILIEHVRQAAQKWALEHERRRADKWRAWAIGGWITAGAVAVTSLFF